MPRELYEVHLEIDVCADESDLPTSGPLTEWLDNFNRAINDAKRRYRAENPIGEAHIYVEVNPHDDLFDDRRPALEITLHGTRLETQAEAEDRWRKSEEGVREWNRLEAERKENLERAEFARLRAKYGD